MVSTNKDAKYSVFGTKTSASIYTIALLGQLWWANEFTKISAISTE